MLKQEQVSALLNARTEQADALIIAAFEPLIHGACVTIIGNLDEDAIQEAKIALLRIVRMFRRNSRLNQKTFVSYVTTAVKRSVLRSSIKNRVRFTVSIDDVMLIDVGCESYIKSGDQKNFVSHLLKRLDKRERKIVKDYFLREDKITVVRLAEMNKVSQTRAFQILTRALIKMRTSQ